MTGYKKTTETKPHSGLIPEQRYVLLIEGLPPSQNKFNSGKLRDRIVRKKGWKEQVFWAVHRDTDIPENWYPVHIQLRCGFPPGGRLYDAGNLSAAEKIATDQLVKMGILKGDSPRYVRTVTLGPCFRATKGYTEYLITPGNYTE